MSKKTELAAAKKLILELMPYTYEDLDPQDEKAILNRIKRDNLIPVKTGTSLHCSDDQYEIDGTRYAVLAEVSTPTNVSVARMVPTTFSK